MWVLRSCHPPTSALSRPVAPRSFDTRLTSLTLRRSRLSHGNSKPPSTPTERLLPPSRRTRDRTQPCRVLSGRTPPPRTRSQPAAANQVSQRTGAQIAAGTTSAQPNHRNIRLGSASSLANKTPRPLALPVQLTTHEARNGSSGKASAHSSTMRRLAPSSRLAVASSSRILNVFDLSGIDRPNASAFSNISLARANSFFAESGIKLLSRACPSRMCALAPKRHTNGSSEAPFSTPSSHSSTAF